MWDKKQEFYFDLMLDGKRAPVKSIGAYWTLIARVASPSQAGALAGELRNPGTFGRSNLVPTLAADEPGYDPAGGYWRGAVWAPTTTMVIRGLEAYGYNDLAREIALQHLSLVARTYQKTGTIWENYSPDAIQQGKPAQGDFVGWTGIGPIMYLLEYAIGLKPNAPRNELSWELMPGERRGCDRFRFNGHVVSLLAEPFPDQADKVRIRIKSDGGFLLRIVFKGEEKTFTVTRGERELVF
jgi:glycogen debranching enzyme